MMPQISPARARQIGLVVAPALFSLAAYMTRARPRRAAGALAGALAYGASNVAWDEVARARGWWRYPAWGREGRFPLEMYGLAGLVAGGATSLICWRAARRYGLKGLAAFTLAWAGWGSLHDLGGSRLFRQSQLMVIEPGAVPALAELTMYASCGLVAYGAMRIVAGPAAEDRLARERYLIH